MQALCPAQCSSGLQPGDTGHWLDMLPSLFNPIPTEGHVEGIYERFSGWIQPALSLDPGRHWFCLCRVCPGSGMLLCSPAPLESCMIP